MLKNILSLVENNYRKWEMVLFTTQNCLPVRAFTTGTSSNNLFILFIWVCWRVFPTADKFTASALAATPKDVHRFLGLGYGHVRAAQEENKEYFPGLCFPVRLSVWLLLPFTAMSVFRLECILGDLPQQRTTGTWRFPNPKPSSKSPSSCASS